MAASDPSRLLLAAPDAQVLLTGSGSYVAGSRLPAVPSVANTVADLGRRLTERAGLEEARLTMLIDPAGPQERGAALVKAAGQASEALMVYYAGHGLVGADNRLYLATRSTVDLTEGIAEYQALPYATVRRVLAGCRAPLTLIVLDCCFAGRAEGAGRVGGGSLDGARSLNGSPRWTARTPRTFERASKPTRPACGASSGRRRGARAWSSSSTSSRRRSPHARTSSSAGPSSGPCTRCAGSPAAIGRRGWSSSGCGPTSSGTAPLIVSSRPGWRARSRSAR
jgi:hypothetical protein